MYVTVRDNNVDQALRVLAIGVKFFEKLPFDLNDDQVSADDK